MTQESWDVVVLGAGAAGLLAAGRSAERGFRTLLLEKNTKAGVKILMSGGTRCNLTQATDVDGIMRAFGKSGSFLRQALHHLGPDDVVRLFEQEGVPTKVESTGKIFPVSDRALDVQQALLRRLDRSGASIRLSCAVVAIDRDESGWTIHTATGMERAHRLIACTGGASYPGCGTVGDGYPWMAKLGHRIVTPRPALVPITTAETWANQLAGITIEDVLVRVVPADRWREATDERAREAVARKKRLDERRGSVLFTHRGLSGPAILNVSRTVTGAGDLSQVILVLDFVPDQTVESLDQELERRAREQGKRNVRRLIAEWVPQRLAECLIAEAKIPDQTKGVELTRWARRQLAGQLKATPLTVTGTLGFPKAEVTAGGVALAEIDPRTMQSRRHPSLYCVGELLDLDGWIGGYNFQSAFSTAQLAADSLG